MRSLLIFLLAVCIFVLAIGAADQWTKKEGIDSLTEAMEVAPFY